jgi:hypothetical protein
MTDTVDRAKVFGERAEAVERIAPGYFDAHFVAEPRRYRWASRWVSGRRPDVACGTDMVRQSKRPERVPS